MSWEVGDKFKGFKLIPPGAHFFHYTLADEGHQFRVGMFLFLKEGQIVSKEWNRDADTFLPITD